MFFGDPSFFSAPARAISPDSSRFNICNFPLLHSSRRTRLRARPPRLLPANYRLAHKPHIMSTCTNLARKSPEMNTCDLLNLNRSRMNSYEKIPGGERAFCSASVTNRMSLARQNRYVGNTRSPLTEPAQHLLSFYACPAVCFSNTPIAKRLPSRGESLPSSAKRLPTGCAFRGKES
jgi:hypothetical protein